MGFFYFLTGIGIIFFAVSFCNIIINKKFGTKQSSREAISMIILAVIGISGIILGSVNVIKTNEFLEKEAYRGFVLLSRGENAKAIDAAENISNISKDNVDALTIKVAVHIMDGETNKAAAEIESIKLGNKITLINPKNKKIIKELESLVEGVNAFSTINMDSIHVDSTSTKAHGNMTAIQPTLVPLNVESKPDKANAATSTKPRVMNLTSENTSDYNFSYVGSNTKTRSTNTIETQNVSVSKTQITDTETQGSGLQVKNAVSNLIKKSMERLNLKTEVMNKIEKLTDIEIKIENGESLSGLKKEILDLAEKYAKDPYIMKLTAGLALERGDYQQALGIMKKVIKAEPSSENKFAYVDIYVQECIEKYNRNGSEGETDSEAPSIKKAINYINNLRPLIFGDKLKYDIQLGKLYFAMGEKEKAEKFIEKSLDKAENWFTRSGLKSKLNKINALITSNQDGSNVSLFEQQVNDVLESIKGRDNNILATSLDRDYGAFFESHLKYSKVNLYISNIDFSNYPAITASVSISGSKEGLFGHISDFDSQDLTVVDTGDVIKEFSFMRNDNIGGNIVLVLDRSGSMNGRPMEDAKSAAGSFITQIDKDYKIGVVSFSSSANIDQSLTSDKTSLLTAIDRISTGGGTNILSGLEAAVSMLANSEEVNTIILMSDGQSNDNLSQVLARAGRNNITIYTVGFGDAEDAYLSSISIATQGKYIKADASVELEHIYENLYSYIVNNYQLQYKVSSESQQTRRLLDLTLNEYNSSTSREYNLAGDNENADNINSGVFADSESKDKIRQINPEDFVFTGIDKSVIYKEELSSKKDYYIQIKGYNLDKYKSIKIGDYTCDEIKETSKEVLTVKLPENLQEGTYNISGLSDDNKAAKLENALTICKSGEMTAIKVGDMKVEAASITRIGYDVFMATGNVIINDFLRTNSSIKISAYDKVNSNEYERGIITGSGKLYVSPSEKGFIAKMLRNREIVVDNGNFSIDSDNDGSYLDLLAGDYGIDIGFANLTVDQSKLTPDGIEWTLVKFDFSNIEFWEELMKKDNKAFPVEGEATVKLTADDVLARLKIGIGMDIVPFKWFKGDGLTIELDTIGPERKFAVEGEFSIPVIKKGLEFSYESTSSNFLIPDEFSIALTGLKIPLTQAGLIYLDSLGGGLGNLGGAISDGWRNADIIGKGSISTALLPIELPVVGDLEILELSDLTFKVRLNFQRFLFSGKVELFGAEMAESEIGLESGKGFWITSEGEIRLPLIIVELAATGKKHLSVNTQAIVIESSGGFDVKAFGKSASGLGIVRFTINKYNTLIYLQADDVRLNIAIDHEGSILNLKEKIKVEFVA